MFLEAELNDFYYKFGNTLLYSDIEIFHLILNSELFNVSYVISCLSVCPRTKSTLTLSHKQSPDVNINFFHVNCFSDLNSLPLSSFLPRAT